jgi:hypothetical protein
VAEVKHTLKTHVAYLIDESSSMSDLKDQVVKVVDNQTAFLASLPDKDHEVRISVYTFSNPYSENCLVSDTDVLRLPSIAGMYEPNGWTALLDATGLAIEDLKLLPTKYGDHSFLIFVFTDGQENMSKRHSAYSISSLLDQLGPQWTVAALVPDFNGKIAMRRYGFADGNVTIWNPNSKTGVEEAGEEMKAALGSYMTGRSQGVTGTRTLFSTDATAVNAATIKAAGLKPLPTDRYVIVNVSTPPPGSPVSKKLGETVWQISDFVRSVNGGKFTAGEAFYELHKSERVQGNKALLVCEKATQAVFAGPGVRAMIGLSDQTQTVMPGFNKDYTIYVQSTSDNRHLKRNTKVIILR